MSDPTGPPAELSFSRLDELAMAAARKKISPHSYLAAMRVRTLGPLLELLNLSRSGALSIDSLPLCDTRLALQSASNDTNHGHGVYLANARTRIGFIKTSRDPKAEDDTQWVAFCRKTQEAAESSAIPKPVAQSLVGAMREMESNLHEHSQRPHDGIVGFRSTTGNFEFVVADSGIGILNGLKQSPDYSALSDAGSAIQLALTNGHSRLKYIDPGRGFGFHDLFVGLANLNSELRFRSDDHALLIDGTSPSLMNARLSQKARLQGFVASVTCHVVARSIHH
jgi:hypothetical protein